MSQIELISKISTKTVAGTVSKPKEGESAVLYRVLGIANGIKSGESTYGEFTAFTGNFKAINLETGKVYQSGKVFLPSIAQTMLEGALSDANTDSVEFAFDIGVKHAANAIGYEYTVTPLVAASDNDPLSALESKVTAALPDNSKGKK